MTKPTVPELRFLLKASEDRWGPDSHYLHVTAYLVQMEGQHVRNLRDHYRGDAHYGLADLEITAQMNGGRYFDGRFYGYQLEYKPGGGIDLARAEAMYRTLSRIRVRMDRLNERFGWAQDFDTWLARVADVLGVKQFGTITDKRPGGTYDDYDYRWSDVTGIHSWLRHQAHEFGKQFQPAEESA